MPLSHYYNNYILLIFFRQALPIETGAGINNQTVKYCDNIITRTKRSTSNTRDFGTATNCNYRKSLFVDRRQLQVRAAWPEDGIYGTEAWRTIVC